MTDTWGRYVQARNLNRVRALKIDVEGAENLVLVRASRLESEGRQDGVICDVWFSAKGAGGREIIEHHGHVGYRLDVRRGVGSCL